MIAACPSPVPRRSTVAVGDDGTEHRQDIAALTRVETRSETLGLTLEESKQVLQTLQRALIERQVAAYLDQQRTCPHCGKPHQLKDDGSAPFRTLFGIVRVLNPRWHHCLCQPHLTKTFRPLATLLPQRTSPELLYLETKWASLAKPRLVISDTCLHRPW